MKYEKKWAALEAILKLLKDSAGYSVKEISKALNTAGRKLQYSMHTKNSGGSETDKSKGHRDKKKVYSTDVHLFFGMSVVVIISMLLFAGVGVVSALTITEDYTVLENQIINEDLTLDGASHCTIRNNVIHGELFINEFSEYNTISDNTIDELIMIRESAYNTLRGNNMGGFLTAAYGSGTSPKYRYDQDIDTSNLVKGKPLYFYFDIHDTVIENLTNIGELYMVVSSGVTIRNLNMDTAGIVLKACHYCEISDCVVDFTSDSTVHKVGFIGLILDNSNHLDVKNNIITITGDSGYGIFGDTVPHSDFSNNIITLYTTGWNTKGFHIYASTDVNVTGCTITALGVPGKPALAFVYPYGEGLFYVTSTNINGSTILAGLTNNNADGDVFYLNTTFDSISVLDDWTAHILWYLDAKVLSSGAPVQGATVTAKDKYGIEAFSVTTDANGNIPKQSLLEYTQTVTGTTFSTPYTITATKSGQSDSKSIDLTESSVIYLSLGESGPDNIPPYMSGYNPAKSATGIAKDTSIIAHIKDNGDGVDQSSIVMTVEGTQVTPTVSGAPNDYTLTYTPSTPFDYAQIVDVTVDAQDLASTPNVMPQDSYSFTTESAPDTTLPAAVTDLAASNPTSDSITLSWTAPGDDGDIGTASQYDIRYSTTKISETNWNEATQCTGEPTPQVAGSAETFTVTGLEPGATYYFALKAADDVPNWAGVSNSPTETTTEIVSGLVGHWKFDEGGGIAAHDSSGEGNDGTLTNMDPATDWVEGKINSALSFDGYNDYVDCGDNIRLDIIGTKTISIWLKISEWASYKVPWSKFPDVAHRVFLQTWPDQTIQFWVVDSTTQVQIPTDIINIDEWTQVVVTIDETSQVAKIYQNGVYINQDTSFTVPDTSAADFIVGSSEADGRYFNGTIDEVKIYNKALSAEEVRADYEAGSTNQLPVADPNGPYTGMEGVPIPFKGNGSYDPDGTIVTYLWTFGDGNNATAVNSTHIYAQDGTYNVTLTVTDNDGATDTSITTATIADIEPTADFSAMPTSGKKPLTVAFTDNSTSYDGIMMWEWDFDNDGVTDSTVQNPAYEYAEDGVYTVSLTVNESDGDSDSRTMVDYITVTEENNDLAAEWHLDDGNGTTTADTSGNGNDGTLVNNPEWITGKIGKALRFDGTDDYIDCGQSSSLKITGAITVEAWVNWTGAGNPYLVTKTGGPSHRSYDLSGNEDGTVEFRVGGADCNTVKSSGTISTPTGEWVHLAGTYEPSSYVRLFVDGALAKENIVAIPASQGDNGLSWYIGAREGNQGWFNGTIDEVKIYNRALSAEEVRAEYEAGSTNQPPVSDPNGPYTGMEGVPLHFKGNSSYDPDGTIVSYLWTFGDGNNATEVNSTHIYAQDGTYNVTLTVTDNDGATDTSITTATIADIEPTADFSASPTSGKKPLTVAFTDNATSYDGIMMWEWDFDNDGVTDSTEQNPAYEYAEEGVYTVSLTVNESDGDSDSRTMVDYITVTEENNDLAAEWHLDDGNGTTAADTSGNGNDGTLVNNPEWITGKIGKALRFDGTDDYIDCGQSSSLKITGAITVEAWVKWQDAGNPYFVTKTGGPGRRSFDLSGNDDGTVEFRVGGADCNSLISSGTISIPAGEWVHLVGTYEPSSYVRLFVDGALAKENTAAIPASQGDNGLSWYIGAREGNQGWFNGTIDEVKIYNRALSAEEVRAEYEAGSTNQPPVADPNGPYTGMEGVPLHFKGNSSYDPDGTIVSYLWTFGDGNNATEVNPTHIYAQDGTYTVTLTVTDNDGATNTSTTTATIADSEPTADFSASPTSGKKPLTVAFTDNSTSYDGIMTWEWDFDNDGETDSTVQNPTHVYAEEGVYTVSLTVYESDGDSDSMTMVDYITVTEENNDLAAEWHLDDGSGPTAVDSSGNGNDGTLVNNPAWVTGKIGKALRFDGTNDYIDCGQESSLKITGAITVEAWVNWTGAGNPYLVTKTGGPSHRSYDLSGNEDGTVEFRVGGADCNTMKSSGTIAIPADEWVHLAGTYEPSSYVRLFVDGALAKENIVAIPASQGDNGMPWYIGAREGKEGWFKGTIDEVKIYNRALSAEEIRADYEAGSTNQPPVADPNGPYTGMEGVPIHIKGNSSYDPDGTIVSYLWTFGDGNNATAVNSTHIYAQDGTYNVTLTVTDNEGATDTSITTATIADTEPAANFSATPTSGQEPLTVAFTDASASHDGIEAWEWDFDNDGVTDSTVQNPTYVFAEEGVYTVSLKVTESDGDSDTMTKVDYIMVIRVNNLPVADPSGPYTGMEGVAIAYDGIGSYDSDGSIVAYEWDFGDGDTSSEVTPTHIYAQNGTYNVTLTVTDNDGATNTSTTTATIADTKPAANFSAMPTSGPEPLTVTFIDKSASHDGIMTWEWDFNNDGVTNSNVQNPTHVYAEDGVYSVSLTVNESDGDSDTTTKTDYITVTKANNPPVADPNGPYTDMEVVPILFNGSGSYDPDGSIVSYLWTFGDGNNATEATPTHTYTQNGTYTVTLTVTDNEGATDTSTTTADIEPDLIPPYTTGHSPAKDAIEVAKNTTIVVHVKDDGAGVDITSIVMTVSGITVTPIITGTPADYTLTYVPSVDFECGQIVNVTVDAHDLATAP